MAGTTGVGMLVSVGAGIVGGTIDGAAIGAGITGVGIIGAFMIRFGVRTMEASMGAGPTILGMVAFTDTHIDMADITATTITMEIDITTVEAYLIALPEEAAMLTII